MSWRDVARIEVPPFRIEWGNPECGWFDAALIAGVDRFDITAGCYAPFPAMLDLIRRCNQWNRPESFVWEAEMEEYVFTYFGLGQCLRIERLDGAESPEVAWERLVSLQDLRRSFYLDFMDHIESPRFSELEDSKA